MKNMEQIRAAHAMRCAQKKEDTAGKEGGANLAKSIPPQIINHGLLQVLAYAEDSASSLGYKNICNYLAEHLHDMGITQSTGGASALIHELADGDSQLLKRATSESLAWFNYARRFLK